MLSAALFMCFTCLAADELEPLHLCGGKRSVWLATTKRNVLRMRRPRTARKTNYGCSRPCVEGVSRFGCAGLLRCTMRGLQGMLGPQRVARPFFRPPTVDCVSQGTRHDDRLRQHGHISYAEHCIGLCRPARRSFAD